MSQNVWNRLNTSFSEHFLTRAAEIALELVISGPIDCIEFLEGQLISVAHYAESNIGSVGS